MFRHSAILRAPEGDSSGGGGDEPKSVFTEEQLIAIGTTVNAALTSRLPKMLSSGIAESFKGMNWEEMLTPVITKIAPKPAAPDDDEGGKKPKKPVGDPDVERRIQELATQLETEKNARSEAERRRIESENARRLDNAKVSLRAALADKLAPGMLEHAVDRWTIVQNRLKVDDNGKALFRVKKAPYKGAPEEEMEVELSEALPTLLEEPDTKFYLPAPKGDGGRGNAGPRSNGRDGVIPTYDKPATTDAEKTQRAYAREQALRARGFGGT